MSLARLYVIAIPPASLRIDLWSVRFYSEEFEDFSSNRGAIVGSLMLVWK